MAAPAVRSRRLSVDDVVAMVHAGILAETERVELVDGILVEMNPIGPEHRGAVTWLTRHFARVAGDAYDVNVQDQLVVREGAGLLSPDVMLVRPVPRTELPTTAELVVEVAQTSQRRDAEKVAEYAAAAVPEYWIVDLVARIVTVHRAPAGEVYAERSEYRDGDDIAPLIGGPAVRVTELLGT